MTGETVHIDSSDWTTTRGWLRMPVPLSDLPAVIRRAVSSSERFSVFELDANRAILASRSNFTSRALRTSLEFNADGACGSRVLVSCRSANVFGLTAGLQYRVDAVRGLLELIASTASD